MKNDKNLGYSFYSNILNKKFDSLEELEKAESNYKKEIEAKEKISAEKKADADKVQKAFCNYNLAKKEYNEELISANKDYCKIISDAKKAFSERKKNAENKLKDAETAYNKNLKDFIEKHPEGYHVTLKDGDNIMTLSHSKTNEDTDIWKTFVDMFNSFIF